jgi:small-conductance mechanosensitive channel
MTADERGRRVTSLPVVPPERMTPRARAYLLIAGTRHLLVGLACLLVPRSFSSPSYDAIKSVIPGVHPTQAIATWGVVFLATAILCLVAAVLGREGTARSALLASVVASALWSGGFIAQVAQHGLEIAVGAGIVWTAVTLKDLTMLRQPMRNPFEPVVRRLAQTEQR